MPVPLVSAALKPNLEQRADEMAMHARPAPESPIDNNISAPNQGRSDLLLLYVRVSALCAVEQVHLLLLLRSRSAHVALVGIGLRVVHTSRLSETRDSNAMPETDEECGGGSDKHISVRWSVCVHMPLGFREGSCGFFQGYTYPYSWGMLAMTDMFAGSWNE
jgi:hypothetical protein